MREVVLDVVEGAAKALSGKRGLEQFGNPLPLAAGTDALAQQRQLRRMGQQPGEPAQRLGAAVLVDGDMVDIGEPQPSLAKAISDGVRRKPGPVLDSAEALLFGGRDQGAVPHERRSGVAMKGVETEDDHAPLVP
jgi:hypothetical protein